MTTKNDITGDSIKSKSTSNLYRSNWESIFGDKEKDMEQESVMIPKDEYEKLLIDRKMLQCLEAAGVDNWPGYCYAMEMYSEEEGEDQ